MKFNGGGGGGIKNEKKQPIVKEERIGKPQKIRSDERQERGAKGEQAGDE